MLNLIVYSKDRPMQLLAFLDSAVIHTRGLFNSYNVVYLASNKEYEDGYSIVMAEHPYVKFIKQTDFKQDVLDAMQYEYTCFAADDDIIYGDIDKRYKDYMDADCVCFSFRLGTNLKYCYPLNKPNSIKDYKDNGDIITWNWRNEEMDFEYPLSVINHVFRTEDIMKLMLCIEFQNPNEFEQELQQFKSELPPHISSYKTSKIFGVPANRVNTTNRNRNGLKYPYTTKELNDKLLNGERIDVANMDYSKVNAAQFEIQYKFIKI